MTDCVPTMSMHLVPSFRLLDKPPLYASALFCMHVLISAPTVAKLWTQLLIL